MIQKFRLEFKELLDRLYQVQQEMDHSSNNEDKYLYRIQKLDMYELLDKLNIKACDYCQYSIINKIQKCDLEVRCQSYMMIKRIDIINNDLNVRLEFKFKVIE